MRILAALAATLLVTSIGCTPDTEESTANNEDAVQHQADVQAILDLERRVFDAQIAGDFDAWLNCFAEDAIVMAPNMPALMNKAAIRQWNAPYWEKFFLHEESDAREVEVAGDWAFIRAHWTWTLTPRDGGKIVEDTGNSIWILRRQHDNSWKIARGIYNSEKSVAESEVGQGSYLAHVSPEQELTAEELAGIRDLDRRFLDAYNRLDVDDLMNCLWRSPDLVVLLYDGTVFVGWDTVRKITEETFSGLASAHVEIDEVAFHRSGDAIMAVGTASYELQPKDGPLQTFSARWTDFRRIEDGQWVYVSDHAQILEPE